MRRTMIRLITKKEIREIFRTGQFRIAGLVTLLLLLMAIFTSYEYYQQVSQQYEEAKLNERNVWESQDSKNPHSAAHYGTYAFKPKYPLSLIDPGVEKFLGISVFLEAHNRNEAQYVAAADQTGLSRFGSITPDFILLFIVPLLIILIGHNIFSKEHERGTLKLIKSQGASLRSLVAGKWLGIFLPILVLTLFVFLVIAVFLGLLDGFMTIEWSAFVLLLLVYLLYYAIINTIVLITSMNVRNSGLALVCLLAIWIVNSLAIPKAASLITDMTHPYPTQQEFAASIEDDKSKGLDGHDPWSEAAKTLEEETLKAYNVSKLEDLPFNFEAYRMQKGEEHEAEVYFKHYQALKETYSKQKGMYNWLSALSPYLPVRFLSMSLAHTDYGTHWHFSDAAEKYRILLQKKLNDDFKDNSAYGDWSYQADKSLWKEIPEFSYESPALDEVLVQNSQSIASLSFWLLLSFGGIVLSIRKIQ